MAGKGETAVLFVAGRRVRPAMVRSLYGAFPVFRAQFDTGCRVLDARLPLPLAAAVFAPEHGADAGLLDRADFGRAALFAYQVALYRTWQDWGMRIGAVAGAGSGTVAAAHVAGGLDLEKAVRNILTGRHDVHDRHVPRAPVPAGGDAEGLSALRAAGFRRVLACGPGPREDAETAVAVGEVPALLAAMPHLQLSGPRIDFEALWWSRHRADVHAVLRRVLEAA
ncbi:acyltransferase domain-containing protein [Streptomyces sp. NRRL B-1140]|uniref:acyltransferase domain-containing protein n=1 Tax=Streptomyces sp. NRRL B-1140 TaxID=1415549 RepID=UPI00131E7D2B|nr:acyltransferase domain-containing protein [Streptomyces sp. NRRL B-1140]